MTVLVTGAGGFVGSHLIARLRRDHAAASIAAWHRPGGDTTRLAGGVEWAPVDLLDRKAVVDAVARVRPSQIYHLAGWAHPGQSWQNTLETYQGNVLATHHLLTATRAAVPAARVLLACSAMVYAPQEHPLTERDPMGPASPYATSKLAQELLGRHEWSAHGVAALIARSFNHTGPGQDPSYVAPAIARQIARIEAGLQEPVLRMGNLEPKRDLSDVRDVVEAYVAMMAKATPGQPYNVCSGRGLSIRSLVDAFVSHARTPVSVVQDESLFRPNDVPMLVGDHQQLTADTGWMPTFTVEHTVLDLLEHWREHVRQSPSIC